MKEPRSDRVIAVALSVVLHGGLIALLVYGWWTFHQQSKPVPTLALDATVVDGRALSRASARPTPAPPQPPPPTPPPVAPPPPDNAAQQAAAEAEKRAAEEKRLAEQKQAKEAEERAEAQKQAQEEAERKEQERVAEQKRLAEEKRKAEEAKQLAKRQAEDAADLQKSLAEEEHLMSVRSSGAMASWEAQVRARITRAWNRPPSARSGVDCIVHVTQIPGGEVVSAKVSSCNGDQAVRDSIEAAAYRASPLPPPPDPALFAREFDLEFKPGD